MADLRASPVNRSRLPGYPTKLQARIDPRLLRDHVPAAWRSRGEIAGVLGVMLAANSAGCSEGSAARPEENQGRATPVSSTTSDRQRLPAVVAPLFEHGEGGYRSRGMLGCIAIAAPVYLSEEEAIAIITDELANAGRTMTSRNVTLNSVIIDGTEYRREYDWVADETTGRWADISGPLEVDLVNETTGIAVEFISEDDLAPLGGHDDAWLQQMTDVARAVGAEVYKHGRGVHFATLYDPVTYCSFSSRYRGEDNEFASTEEEAQVRSEKLLREQVKDFVDWLKGQGVI